MMTNRIFSHLTATSCDVIPDILPRCLLSTTGTISLDCAVVEGSSKGSYSGVVYYRDHLLGSNEKPNP
jgi:hypothetical protein